MNVLIFANGDEPAEGWEWVRPYLLPSPVLIAADGGARHLQRLGLTPDILVGDLDSLDVESRRAFIEKGVELIIAPQEKDESDLELALKYAAEKYQETIMVFGANGGRLDQIISNMLLLSIPELSGMEVNLIEPHQKAWMVENQTTIKGKPGDLVSLLPLWGEVQIRRTDGLKWLLNNEWLSPGPARGVSNQLIGNEASVILSAGRLLCVHTDRNWKR
jgi:thiamine pyrophosphokinase